MPLTLLSLFTTTDRAETIEGDLLEERQARGSFWFWTHVIRTTIALSRQPLQTAVLKTLSVALLTVLGFALLAITELSIRYFLGRPFFPQQADIRWIIIGASSILIGMSLVRIAAGAGFRAVILLALLSIYMFLWDMVSNILQLSFYTSGMDPLVVKRTVVIILPWVLVHILPLITSAILTKQLIRHRSQTKVLQK